MTSGEKSIGTSQVIAHQENLLDSLNRNGTLSIEVFNNGAAALDEFIVQLRSGPDSSFFNYIGNSDFNAIDNSNLIFVSTNKPHTLGAGERANFIINIGAADGILFLAKAVANTKIQITGNII